MFAEETMEAGENRFAPELKEKKKSLNCYKTQHRGAQRESQSMA